MSPVRVLLAEDMEVIRSALVALLELEDDLEVVASVARGDEVMAALREHVPDVAVLDLDMPGANGVELAEAVAAAGLPTRVIILTALGRPALIRAAMEAGAAGFVLKTAPASTLVEGIRRVAAGGQVLHPELATAALRLGRSPLTPRETAVLDLVGAGCSNREAAERLFLTEGTVRNYLTAVVDKLGARSRIDAVRIAQDNGWI
ncbi:MAG: response regulator transcription factor [Kineosporiaceae bacterium]